MKSGQRLYNLKILVFLTNLLELLTLVAELPLPLLFPQAWWFFMQAQQNRLWETPSPSKVIHFNMPHPQPLWEGKDFMGLAVIWMSNLRAYFERISVLPRQLFRFCYRCSLKVKKKWEKHILKSPKYPIKALTRVWNLRVWKYCMHSKKKCNWLTVSITS